MESTTAQASWRSGAAYLYLLEADSLALAWEYLRRNPHYRGEWEKSEHDAARWHCRHFHDPFHDSRHVQPDWTPVPSCVLRLAECSAASPEVKFSLWAIPGRKTLDFNGASVSLNVRAGMQTWRLSLSRSLQDGSPFAFEIPGGLDSHHACAQISRFQCLTSRRSSDEPLALFAKRPTRESVLHMRSLQALDGVAAGATHREIAEAIFGAEEVWRRWNKYSELPTHIRYLLRRGRAFVNGGYHRLLSRP